MKAFGGLVAGLDHWQRSHRPAAVLYGVAKKFGDDDANQFVVALGWYGFVAIYPLLLVVTAVLGFIGAPSLGHRLVVTLHHFPVIGTQFNPGHGSDSLHGSVTGLVIGLVGLLYGAQGVTQTAQRAMVRVWNVPRPEVPGFLPRLARSLAGLGVIGGAFVLNAGAATLATGSDVAVGRRVVVLLSMVVVNAVLYLLAFRVLTPTTIGSRGLVPGASAASVGFTFLITVGSGVVQHQIQHSSATYGQFAIVIGLVGFLFLLAKISLYGAELNPVLSRGLWPRAVRETDPTEADQRAVHHGAQQRLRPPDRQVGAGSQQADATGGGAGDRTPGSTSPPSRAGRDRDEPVPA